jgi:hypothetical protein
MNTEPLIAVHQLSAMVMSANTAGISHVQSLTPPGNAGNCLNWVVGHLVKARNDALGLLSRASPFPNTKFDRYGQGQPPLLNPEEPLPFEELLADFAALQEPWIAALKNATPEQLLAPVPNSPTGNPNETVGSLLAALAFHEAYHLGQTGILRRILGLDRVLP